MGEEIMKQIKDAQKLDYKKLSLVELGEIVSRVYNQNQWNAEKFMYYSTNEGTAFIAPQEVKPLTNKEICQRKKRSTSSIQPDQAVDPEATKS